MFNRRKFNILDVKFKQSKGLALPMALLLMFISFVVALPVVNLVYTNLKSSEIVEAKTTGNYAADAGIQYALWKYKNDAGFSGNVTDNCDEPTTIELPDGGVVGDYYVSVSTCNLTGSFRKVVSIATHKNTGSTTTMIAYLGTSGYNIFDYVLATLCPGGNLDVYGNNNNIIGDVYISGDITGHGANCAISGNVTLTGQITGLSGTQIEYTNECLEEPDWMKEKIETFIQRTGVIDNINCPTECKKWTDIAGNYSDPLCISGDMNLLNKGTYNFFNTVCIQGNLNISGESQVTFHKPVKVSGNLVMSNAKGKTTFKDLLIVNGYLSTTRASEFEGKVLVKGEQSIESYEASFSSSVNFYNTFRTIGDIRFQNPQAIYEFHDVVYAESGNAVFINDTYVKCRNDNTEIKTAIIADNVVSITGGADITSVDAQGNIDYYSIPFIISNLKDPNSDGIYIYGSGTSVVAILYAPAASIEIAGNADFEGSIVGRSISLSGNKVTIYYPVELRTRPDIQGEENTSLKLKSIVLK